MVENDSLSRRVLIIVAYTKVNPAYISTENNDICTGCFAGVGISGRFFYELPELLRNGQTIYFVVFVLTAVKLNDIGVPVYLVKYFRIVHEYMV